MDSCRVLHVAAGRHSIARAADVLEAEGFAVATATSVTDAKQILETETIDCVLSELELADGDAFDLLGWLRETDPSLPFVLLSPETADNIVDRAIDAGATEFVSNLVPAVSPDLLAMRIRNAIRATADPSGASPETKTTQESDPLFQAIRRALGDYNGDLPAGTANGNGRTSDSDERSLVDVVRDALTDTSGPDDSSDVIGAGKQLLWYSLGQGVGSDRNVADTDGRGFSGNPITGPDSGQSMCSRPGGQEEREPSDSATAEMNRLLSAIGSAHSDGGTVTDAVGGGELAAPVEASASNDDDGNGATVESTADEWRFGPSGADAVRDTPSDDSVDAPPEVDQTESSAQSDNRNATAEDGSASVSGESVIPDETGGPTAETVSPDLSELSDDELIDFAAELGEAKSDSAGTSTTADDALGSETGANRTETAPPSEGEMIPLPDSEQAPGPAGDRDSGSNRPSMERPPETSSSESSGRRSTGEQSAQDGEEHGEVASESQSSKPLNESAAPESAGLDTTQPESDQPQPEEPQSDAFGSARGEPVAESASTHEGSPTEASAKSDTPDPSATDEFEPTATGLDNLSPPDVSDGEAGEAGLDTDASPGDFGDFGSTEEYHRPEHLDLSPGTSVLVQCGSQDDRREAACTDLLDPDHIGGKQVLLIRYRRMDEWRLERIATSADRVKFVSIGYTQPLPPDIEESVSTVKINNPNDLTRLGIVVTATVDNWGENEAGIVACLDPLDAVMQYKGVESLFRFLHLFLGKLNSTGVVSHFHVDPSAGDPQKINVFKPLFDAVLTIDSVGTHLESG